MDHKDIFRLYQDFKAERQKYESTWQTISRYAGIRVDPSLINKTAGQVPDLRDEYIDDPTAAVSINQASDYIAGIMWGTGKKAVRIKPSRYIKKQIPEGSADEWYKNVVTDNLLFHHNHADAGFSRVFNAYMYDQVGFGTSGIGVFPNPAFKEGIEENAFTFRGYGIDTLSIGEGKSGAVDYVFDTVSWRVTEIVAEFATKEGVWSDEAFNDLPDKIKECWNKGKYTDVFTIVHAVLPNRQFNPKMVGKRGAKYIGVWFLNDASDSRIFFEEHYKTKPIAIARQIKVRGEVYGRSNGTMLISTIRLVNHIVGTITLIAEKMGTPALGMFANALEGQDGVVDASPRSLTVFRETANRQGGRPIFPLSDTGDPSALTNFLLPYLNEKIGTAFRIDTLLDFNSAKEMTATESLQRFVIRGKSLSGMLIQQKTELFDVVLPREMQILLDAKEFDEGMPEAVRDAINEGRPWFEIEYTNEMEKLTNTESVESMMQFLNVIMVAAEADPALLQAVDWYGLVNTTRQDIDGTITVLKGRDVYDGVVEQQKAQANAQMQIQAGLAGADITKKTAEAEKAQRRQ